MAFTRQALLRKEVVVVLLRTLLRYPFHGFLLFFNLQLYVGHPEHVAAFKSSLSVLAASPNQPLSDLINKAQEAYEGNVYFHYLLL